MSLAIISLVFQALLIVHCIKTGRNQIWIWVLALLSFAGVIAYVAAELIPDLLRSRATQRTVQGRAARRWTRRRTCAASRGRPRSPAASATSQRYAEELLRQNLPREAIDAYRQCLRGLYEHDPNLMLGLAQAQFAAWRVAAARADARRADPAQPGVQVARGPPAVRPRARSRRPAGARAGGIPGACRLLPRRRGDGALRAAAARGRTRRRSAQRAARAARAGGGWRQPTIAAPRKAG